MTEQVDVLIIGGGLIGASLMLALANSGKRVLLVEAKPFDAKQNTDFDARSLALSPASQRILEMLKVWPLLQNELTPIETIHVSEQGRFGTARLKGDKRSPLGYVVEMQVINHALYALLDKKTVLAPAKLLAVDKEKSTAVVAHAGQELSIQARLIVAADGAESSVRRLLAYSSTTKDYGQFGLVANIGLQRSHHHRAYERFTPTGPLALLPMTANRVSLVWSLEPQEAERLKQLPEPLFLAELQKTFGYRLGRFIKVGQRIIYPLRQVITSKQAAWPFVFVGNAAHTLHPVAGQGFNLGLRDAASLAQCILQYGLNAEMLAIYQTMRQHDQKIIRHLTDGLIQIFTSQMPGMAFARNLGLLALDNLPILKQSLAHYARGFGGVTPDLVCGITLTEERQSESAI